MEPSPKAGIDAFLNQSHIALAGYSRNPKKFGQIVYRTLKGKGYNIYPVNPEGGTAFDGTPIYRNLASLPEEVNSAIISTNTLSAVKLTKEAIDLGIKYLWIQQMSGSKDLKAILKKSTMTVIYNRCILLYAQPAGIHRLHRSLLWLFGRLPK